MSLRREVNTFTLIVLEGPRNPWWLIIAILCVGLLAIQCEPPLFWIGVGFVVVVFWWMCVRRWQRLHYEHVASITSTDACPKCGYALVGLAEPLCPECGVHAVRYIEDAKRIAHRGDGKAPRQTTSIPGPAIILVAIFVTSVFRTTQAVAVVLLLVFIFFVASERDQQIDRGP